MAFADPQSGRTVKPLEVGYQTLITLSGTVSKGDLVGFSTGWKRADADTGPIKPNFIALKGGVSGDVIPVCTEAEVDGFTGGTDGTQLYPSGTAGKYADSQVNSQACIGTMVSTTAARIRTDVTAR